MTNTGVTNLWPIFVAALAAPVACSCPSEKAETKVERPATVPEGLRDDVVKACEFQAAWPKRIHSQCTNCESGAQAPACGCPKDTKEYSGKCAKEALAKRNEKSCEEVYKCTYKCMSNNCECFKACYDGHEACAKLAADLEGCLAEVCDSFCR